MTKILNVIKNQFCDKISYRGKSQSLKKSNPHVHVTKSNLKSNTYCADSLLLAVYPLRYYGI